MMEDTPIPLPISPLPPATVGSLRSSIVIPSIPAVLSELIQNSLDAQSTSIRLSYDLDRWTICCSDDGTGLSCSNLSKVGTDRYMTSKLPSDGSGQVETFGFRGEALASLADVGMLEIESRTGHVDETHVLILRDGVRLVEGASRAKRITPGTTVTVRDIFYKWPVRRRTLTTPSGQLNLINKLKQTVATLALLHPRVSFSMFDTSFSTGDAGVKRILVVNETPEGVLGRWRQLWGRAGVENVCHISKADEDMKIEGFISLTASHVKLNQYIFVNGRPLAPCSPLQKVVNSTVFNSSFALHSSSHLMVSPSKQPARGKGRKSPKKSFERHPIFIFNLTTSLEGVDVAVEPEKRIVEFHDEKKVHGFVEKVIQDFLKAGGFLHDSIITQTPSVSPIKPVVPTQRENISQSVTCASQERPAEIDVLSLCKPSTGSEAEPVQWRDPRSKEKFWLDPQSGNTWKASDSTEECGECRGPKIGRVTRSGLKRQREDQGEEQETPEWLKRSLNTWVNPVFPSASTACVPTIWNEPDSSTRTDAYTADNAPAPYTSLVSKHLDAFFHLPALVTPQDGGPSNVSRQAFGSAKFIAQVDRKFLLTSIGGTLLVVDQHAASERVRVEKYFCDLFDGAEVRKRHLDKPVPVLLGRAESEVVITHRATFSKWGLEVVDESTSAQVEGDYVQTRFATLPRVVFGRLQADSRLLQELVRSFAAQIVDHGVPKERVEGEGWSSRLRGCPVLLLELINSKACRGAIMFNDVLTDGQAMDLLHKLAATYFPFQCAHGRPSLIPLVNIASTTTSEARKDSTARTIHWDNL